MLHVQHPVICAVGASDLQFVAVLVLAGSAFTGILKILMLLT